MGNKHLKLLNQTNNNSSFQSYILLYDINIIWLDSSSNEKSDHNLKFLSELRQIHNSIRTFNDVNICEEFLRSKVNENEIIFLIVSGTIGKLFVPRIHELISIDSIYIFCCNTNHHELWSNKYSKSKGKVFSEIFQLCQKLKQDIQHSQNNLIPIQIINNEEQLNHLEPNFMYSQLLKETLINIEYDENAKKDFIQFSRSQIDNLETDEMDIIEDIENNYEKYTPIWWYTRDCFIHKILNKALRTENIDILIKMAFFIRDLHQQIEQLYISQKHDSFIVYRGQGMTICQFEKISNCKSKLISFQNFLSTSRNKQISLNFARNAIQKPGIRGIIFHMKIDSTIVNISSPYASINGLGYFDNKEEEILFSTHTVFRIENIQQIKNENNIWQIDLQLTTNQDDIQLEKLTKHLRQDIQSTTNPWENLANLFLTMRQFDKAQEIYENISQNISQDDYQQLAFIYHQLGCVHNAKNNIEQALEYFHQSLYIKGNHAPNNYCGSQLADTYLNIGSIYHTQGNLDDALLYYQYALGTNINDQIILASLYNNIGMVHKTQKDFSNAIKYFEKSLQIDLVRLPSTHPDLATTYSNLGSVYFALNDYINALSNYEKALRICRLSLPHDHPSLLTARTNYENSLNLMPTNDSESALSAPVLSQRIPLKTKLDKRSSRLSEKISSYVQTIKRKK
ncbi:unnamed protein product [Adineta steineri]|uniref:ADP ribosyltransferase domain-containing protein n=1 Tax=Adineta steineri TaxID=433720 RepID=A0A814WGJ9_9BILA|nr:unnamed protein product [Adineta steineri]CAF1201972.1 unnamed protein product [Adineta steineri]